MAIFGDLIKVNMMGRIVESLPKPYDDEKWQAYLSGKGYAVNHSTALRVAVVIRCADVVAKTMASLGCHLYKESGNSRERAKAHQLYKLLRYLPNPETTAYEFWHMYVFSLMLTKGAYAKIVRDQNGFIRELWNIPTNRVFPGRNSQTGERYIDVTYSSNSYWGTKVSGERIYAPNFMHTPGLRFQDGDDPHDFINIAADVLGLSMSLNGYAKDFFENGANLGGFVEYPNAVNLEAFNKFKDDWQKAYSGVVNQHRWAILEGGFKLTKFDSKPEEAQALESRKFEIAEVCRIMGVPPHKVYDLDRATFNNIEEINIEYVQETIDPMDERLDQTVYKDLLTTLEQKRFYTKFNTNKLLKGNTVARTNYYNSMRQNGVMNADDIRELEDMNKLPEGVGGDVYLVNGNMISLANAAQNLPKSLQTGSSNNISNKIANAKSDKSFAIKASSNAEKLIVVKNIIAELPSSDKFNLGPRWFYDESDYRRIGIKNNMSASFVEIRIIDGKGHVNMAVLPEYRGVGLGRLLMETAIDSMHDYAEVTGLIATIKKANNEASIALATSLGFTEDNGGEEDGDITLSLNLNLWNPSNKGGGAN